MPRLPLLSSPPLPLPLLLATLGVGVSAVLLIVGAPASARVSVGLALLVGALPPVGVLLWYRRRQQAAIRATTARIHAYLQRAERVPLADNPEPLHRLNHAIVRCLDHLDETLTLQRRLTAMASHDARNALASLLMASEAIEEELTGPSPDPGEVVMLNQIVRSSGVFMQNLLTNVLSAARHGLGALQLNPSPLRVEHLLFTACERLTPLATQKGILLRMEAPASLELVADQDKLDQVLANLLHNAVKFSEPGSSVEVGATAHPGSVTLRVRDYGVGMTKAQIADLFRPFATHQQAGTHGEAGTGLGLWICKTYVDLHGGTLHVESAPGEGTTFYLTLPNPEPSMDDAYLAAVTTDIERV